MISPCKSPGGVSSISRPVLFPDQKSKGSAVISSHRGAVNYARRVVQVGHVEVCISRSRSGPVRSRDEATQRGFRLSRRRGGSNNPLSCAVAMSEEIPANDLGGGKKAGCRGAVANEPRPGIEAQCTG